GRPAQVVRNVGAASARAGRHVNRKVFSVYSINGLVARPVGFAEGDGESLGRGLYGAVSRHNRTNHRVHDLVGGDGRRPVRRACIAPVTVRPSRRILASSTNSQ